MKKYFLLLFLFFEIKSQAQNLIINPSFEDTIQCSLNPNFGGPETAPPWVTLTQSPDYFSYNYCGGGFYAGFGQQTPRTGIAMLGFACSHPNFQGRETFTQQLSDTLVNSHVYCVRFYVSLAGQVQYATDAITALFTNYPLNDSIVFSFSVIPQIKNAAGNVISDTLNWTEISGSFVAQGGEKYITIGNLLDDANTLIDTMPWGNPNPSYAFSYYYIDDVSVTDCTVGINNINPATTKSKLYPNPTKQTQVYYTNTLATNETGNLQVTDMLGNILATYNLISGSNKITINTAAYAKGVYVVKVNVTGMVGESLKLVVE